MVKRILQITLFSLLFLLAGTTAQAQQSGAQSIGCNIFIPNAFTPNGDEINERFKVGLSDNCKVIEYEMKIFDRWGRLVYESTSPDPEKAWDGTADRKEVQKGVYMWNVHAKVVPLATTSGEPEVVNRKGTVVLIR